MRGRIARLLLAAGLAWAGASAIFEVYRGWRALPPHFDRIPGTLRWHDREARRLRLFVGATATKLPPNAGCWAWQSPAGSAMRRGELFQWASFLAPQHDLVLDDLERRCPWRVVYWGLEQGQGLEEAPQQPLLEHRFGLVVAQ